MTEQGQDEFLDTDEAVRYLGVTRRTLERYIDQGKITRYKRGITRKNFFRKSELDDLRMIRPESQED